MARFLALDGDTNRIQLLSASVKGDVVRLEQSATWDEDQPITKANAAAAGERLRAKLKESRIAAAPLLVCIGRDRIILKEIKIPAVPPHEEPAIVRFQALKELTEGGEDSILDYVPIATTGNERRVQIMAVKKDLVAAYRTLAEVAGLKLATVSPRPFAILAGLQRAIATKQVPPPASPEAAMAMLVRGDKWGEFAIVHHGSLTITRSLAGPALTNDAALLGEIRRNLAVHANQHPESPVRALYLAEPDTPGGLRERMQDSLAIPVHAYEPAIGVSVPDGPAGVLAGPAGMFALQASGDLRINFAQPRQPKPPKDPFKRVVALTAAACALILVSLGAFSYLQISAKKAEIAKLQQRVTQAKKGAGELGADEKRIKAIDDWTNSEINWLDDFYDLTARMEKNGRSIQVVEIAASPQDDRTGKNAKKAIAVVKIRGISKEDEGPLDAFMKELAAEPAYSVGPKKTSKNTQYDKDNFLLEFTFRVDIQRRTPDKYVRTFEAPVPPKRQRGGAQGGFPFGGGGGPGFGGGPQP